MKTKIHFEILNSKQKKLLEKLSFLGKSFYLAGGTALSLYFNHRTSLDFDFYTKKKFKKQGIYDLLRNNLDEKDIVVTVLEDNTFAGVISGVNVSFFYYRYPLLEPIYKIDGVYLSSLEDISAMKIVAVIQRPAKRDYVDLYYLLKRFSVKELFDFCKKKYINFNPYLAIRAMVYFEDIEKESLEKRGIKIFDQHFFWRKAKEEIFEKVKKYQLEMLK